MALSIDALTDLATIKEYLSLNGNEADGLLERLIEVVSAHCNAFTGRKLTARDYSYLPADPAYDPDNAVLAGTGHPELLLPQYPVITLDSLLVDGQAVQPAASGDGQGYFLDRAAGVLALTGRVFPRAPAMVQLVYRAGFAAVPPDLAQAAVEQVAERFQQSGAGQGRLGLMARTLADGSVSYNHSELLPQVREVLQRYRSRSVL